MSSSIIASIKKDNGKDLGPQWQAKGSYQYENMTLKITLTRVMLKIVITNAKDMVKSVIELNYFVSKFYSQ